MNDKIKTEGITYKVDKLINETEKSGEEGKSLSEDRDLKEESKVSEHDRKEKLRNIYARGVMFFIYVMFAIAIISVSLLFLHLILPEKLHWLTAKQTDKLFTILSSGLIASLLSGAFQRYLFKP